MKPYLKFIVLFFFTTSIGKFAYSVEFLGVRADGPNGFDMFADWVGRIGTRQVGFVFNNRVGENVTFYYRIYHPNPWYKEYRDRQGEIKVESLGRFTIRATVGKYDDSVIELISYTVNDKHVHFNTRPSITKAGETYHLCSIQ